MPTVDEYYDQRPVWVRMARACDAIMKRVFLLNAQQRAVVVEFNDRKIEGVIVWWWLIDLWSFLI